MRLPTGQGKTWTAKRVSSARRVRDIQAYRSAEKDGEWLTLTEAAKHLGVSSHMIRRLIQIGALAAEQVVRGAPHQLRAADLETDRVKKLPSPERVARVVRRAKTCFQCLQILDEGLHNESSIPIGRVARSTGLLSSSMRPSSRNRMRAGQRSSAWRMAWARGPAGGPGQAPSRARASSPR
jgi:excisionase family DNA binding protein